ncbi:MAG TPA: tripartite tricarboxylate transporter substrate binding protein [Burkholderiaceae bacterium]|nr:tripartite tricarboxylate transporter substrate binding protein [Burkholderiaceae bacterium]
MTPFAAPRRAFVFAPAAALALTALAPGAWATDGFPSRPLRIVVPFPAGQGADASARVLAKELEAVLGQPVIVDNRPGGNNVIGAKAVTGAPADGYTLFFGTNSPMAANAVFYRSPGYDAVKDFAPVAMLGRAPWVVIVSAASPIQSFDELVRRSSQQSGGVSFAVGSTGYQLAAILLASASGMKANIVPYKGSPQAITDVVGQQVNATLTDFGTVRPLIEAGRARPLLAFDNQRIEALPSVPSVKDLKLSVPILSSWTALYVRAGTPESVIARLSDATRQAIQSPVYKEYVDKNNAQVAYAEPQALARFQRQEIEHYQHAMKVGHVEPQ